MREGVGLLLWIYVHVGGAQDLLVAGHFSRGSICIVTVH